MQKQQGFTLLEIILVITLLVGLTYFALMTMPNQTNNVVLESQRLVSALQFVIRRSELERHIFSLQLSQHEWKLLTLCNSDCKNKKIVQKSVIWPENFWIQTYQKQYPLHKILPNNIRMQLYIDNKKIKVSTHMDTNVNPIIIFFPGGENNIFTIELIDEDTNTTITINYDNNKILSM